MFVYSCAKFNNIAILLTWAASFVSLSLRRGWSNCYFFYVMYACVTHRPSNACLCLCVRDYLWHWIDGRWNDGTAFHPTKWWDTSWSFWFVNCLNISCHACLVPYFNPNGHFKLTENGLIELAPVANFFTQHSVASPSQYQQIWTVHKIIHLIVLCDCLIMIVKK